MRKTELAGRLARQSGVSRAEAADRLDRVVHDIVSRLRKRQTVALPGLGQFRPGADSKDQWIFEFENKREGE